MSSNFNLIPPEVSIGKNFSRAIGVVKALGVISAAAFIFFVAGLAVFFIISVNQLNEIKGEIADLQVQVESLSSSEQQLILVEDRIAKIVSLQGLSRVVPNLNSITTFLGTLTGDNLINQLEIASNGIDLLVNLKTNPDISTFVNSLENPDVFKSVNLVSFSYNPDLGYSTDVKMVYK